MAAVAKVWEGSPKRDGEVATSWPRPATDLHIVHRWTSIAALCFGMPCRERGALFSIALLGRSLGRFCLGNSVQIQTPVLSAEPPTSISPRTLREGVEVMHSHFSNGDTLIPLPFPRMHTCNHDDSSLIRTFFSFQAFWFSAIAASKL